MRLNRVRDPENSEVVGTDGLSPSVSLPCHYVSLLRIFYLLVYKGSTSLRHWSPSPPFSLFFSYDLTKYIVPWFPKSLSPFLLSFLYSLPQSVLPLLSVKKKTLFIFICLSVCLSIFFLSIYLLIKTLHLLLYLSLYVIPFSKRISLSHS